jgi:hypothetical protein
MQLYTIFFIVVSAPHVSGGNVSPTLAVAANKFDKHPMLHVQFLSS